MKKSKGIVFMGMGFELAGLMVGALYLGQALDERFHTQGLAVAGLSFLVLMGWLYHLIVLLKSFMNQSESDKQTGERE